MKKALILYVPVIHKGYVDLLNTHKDHIDHIFILHEHLVSTLTIYKEIRMLDSTTAYSIVKNIVSKKIPVSILTTKKLPSVRVQYKHKGFITLNDEVCENLIRTHLHNPSVIYDTVFLRWDSKKVSSDHSICFDRESSSPIDKKFMEIITREAEKTSDWWRRVGALVVNPLNLEILFSSHNTHIPNEHTPYILGDVRDFVRAGTHGNITDALHAEQILIGTAARLGVSLKDMNLYVNIFPCPSCANLISLSGISKLFFSSGHASLYGEEVIKKAGIEIVRVL